MQDLEDDLKIGVKSTAIKFKKNIKFFLTLVYSFSFIILIIANLLIIGLIKLEFIFLSDTNVSFDISNQVG